MSRRTVTERFWAKVEKTDSCWLWTAATARGYGRFGVTSGVTCLAHRWAYEALVGPIPDGLTLDHLCRTPACVRPDHLEPVTAEENLARIPSRTHCALGHELTEANSYYTVYAKTGRKSAICRTCHSDKAKARYLARRGAAA